MASWRCVSFLCAFFFSSRRRHTRSLCDWSSDVCSSDLRNATLPDGIVLDQSDGTAWMGMFSAVMLALELARTDSVYEDMATKLFDHFLYIRSEERRVGKECRSRWRRYDEKKNRDK